MQNMATGKLEGNIQGGPERRKGMEKVVWGQAIVECTPGEMAG